MKRMLALLCAMLMLISFAVSCGKTEPSETTAAATTAASGDATTAAPEATTPAETEPPKAFDQIEAQNLGGVFHVRYAQADSCYEDFHAETLNGDVKNDLIYERNSMVEEKLGIDIQISWNEIGVINTDCKTQVQSGGSDYDLFGGHRSSLILSYQGMQYDLSDVTTLDLTQEWWDQDYVDAVSIGDSLYTVIGDAGVSTLLFVSSMTFNKRLMDEAQLAYPYDLVREGKWTMDSLLNLTADYSDDLNGDGKLVREDDRFALLGWGTETTYSLFYCSDFAFVNKNTAGEPMLEYDTDKLNGVLEKLTKVCLRENVFVFTGDATVEEQDKTFAVFSEGRALFSDIVLSKIGTFYSAMEDDFGIIPPPKFDETQEDYCAYLGYTIPVMFMSSNAADPERTGTVMEALCTASYDHVTPQMFEIVTKLKNARDEDSSEMIEIIIRNKFIDTAHFYDIEGYGTLPRTIITNKTSNPASLIKSFERIAAKEWEKIIVAFDKLG